MNNKTVLTDEEIIMIGLQDNLIEHGIGGYILPIAFARAIEKAVLQSKQVQEWKRDAERFRKIMYMTRSERKERLFFDWDEDVIKAIDEYK